MLGILIGIPLMALLAVLQSTVLSHVRLLDGRPDAVLIAVVSWSVARQADEAMAWGFIGGAFLDLFSGVPFGSTSIALVAVAYLISFPEGRFWESHVVMPLGVMLVASTVFHVLGIATLLLIGRPMDLNGSLTRVLLPSTFMNLVLILPALQLAYGLSHRLFPPEVKI
ncbi:MAG TPA: rod shape-determining protein MreD [Anaerolineales bacterium]|nr:rod shape-determining protein MreD [Anaerolineales bacterium]